MIIASFNVNSVRQRIEHLSRWLGAKPSEVESGSREGFATGKMPRAPDIVCLQELKCVDEAFPRSEIEALGYNVATHGQKTFNGVAILSKYPIEVEHRGIPGFADEQARYIEVVASVPDGAVRVCGVYFPNGNPAPGPKYEYKLAFMEALTQHARNLLTLDERLIIAGDYNIIPDARDAKFPEAWANDALALPQSRAAMRKLEALGFTDALRATSDAAGLYTFWDYQAGAWQRNNGIRIDHLLLSPLAADRLKRVGIDKELRAEEKPSDHVPIWCELG